MAYSGDYLLVPKVFTSTGTVTNFTYMLEVTSTDFFSACTSDDETKIRVVKDDGTELAFHVLEYDRTGNYLLISFLWIGNVTSATSLSIRVYPALTANLSYSSSDTYGQFNTYKASIMQMHTDGGATDVSVNENNATGLVGTAPTVVSGKLGDASSYILGSYINTTTLEIVATGGEITLSSWVKFLGTGGDTLLGSGNEYEVGLRRSGGVAQIVLNSFTTNDRASGTTTLLDDVWYFIVGRYDGTTLDIFVNGTLENSVTPTGSWLGLDMLSIAGFGNDTGTALAGSLEHLAVFNEGISDAEIKEDFEQTDSNSSFWGTGVWTTVGTSSSIPVIANHYRKLAS